MRSRAWKWFLAFGGGLFLVALPFGTDVVGIAMVLLAFVGLAGAVAGIRWWKPQNRRA